MNRWIAILASIWFLFLSGGGTPTPSWGTPLVHFTDPSSDQDTFIGAGVWPMSFVYSSWTQTVATTNTNIGAILNNKGMTTGSGTAWLTNAVGPGTTAANVIAVNDFTAPVLSDAQRFNLDTAPMTTLFMGLTLSPGTYYLILKGPAPTVNPFSYGWPGDSTGVATTSAGFTVGSFGQTLLPDILFPPATEFETYDGPGYLFYSVESAPVPLPPALLLFGSGLLGLGAWRRLRKS